MDELARRRALDTYHVLDTLPEDAYDDIVRLAALLCDTPTALVSLIDRDRQWLKARVGFELSQTPREVAFCDHAIRDPDAVLEVPDATRDPRFAHNPLVTAENGIRFYAGVPLVTPSGAAVGTVCVIDSQPRALVPRQREALASLARLTMNLLEHRHRERDLERRIALQRIESAEAEAQAEAGAPGAAVAPPPPRRSTLVLFELQDQAGATLRHGERALERLMQQLGDSHSRSTGSAESIVLLHGDEADQTLARLQTLIEAFEARTGLRLLRGIAQAQAADEPFAAVFLRADESLSQAKDAEAERRRAAA
jgi:GAF domain-containing protein